MSSDNTPISWQEKWGRIAFRKSQPKARKVQAQRVSEREAWWLDWCSTSKQYGSLISAIEATEDDIEKMGCTGAATPELEMAFEERLGL